MWERQKCQRGADKRRLDHMEPQRRSESDGGGLYKGESNGDRFHDGGDKMGVTGRKWLSS